MRLAYLVIFAVLIASCEKPVEIKNSSQSENIKDAYIRTTRVEVINDSEEALKPSIKIISPKNLDMVKGEKLMVNLSISNFKLVTPDKYPAKGQGHIQVWVDGMEFRGSKTEFVFENESDGIHTVKAELMMSNNTVLNYSDEIKIIINRT